MSGEGSSRSRRPGGDGIKFPSRSYPSSPSRYSGLDKSPRRKAGIRVPICPALDRCDNENCELFHDKAHVEGEASLDSKGLLRASKLQRVDDNSGIKATRTNTNSDEHLPDRRRKPTSQSVIRVVQSKSEGDERIGRTRDARVIEMNGFDGSLSLQVQANLTRSSSRDLHMHSRSRSFSRSRSYSADSDRKRKRAQQKISGQRKFGLSDFKNQKSKHYKRRPNSPSFSRSSRSRSGSRSSSGSQSRSDSRQHSHSRSRSYSRSPPRSLDPKFAPSQYNKPFFRQKNNFQQSSSFSRPLSPRSRNSFSHASPSSRHSQDSPRRPRSRDASVGRGNSSDRSVDSGSPGRGDYQSRMSGSRGSRQPSHRSFGSKVPLPYRSSQRGRSDVRGDDRRRFGWSDRQGSGQGSGRALRTRDLREGRGNAPIGGFNQDRGPQSYQQRRPNFNNREYGGRGGRFRDWNNNSMPDRRGSGQDPNMRPPFRRDGPQGLYRERMAFNPARMARGGFRRDNNNRFNNFGAPRFNRDEPPRDAVRIEGRVDQQPPVEKVDPSQEKPPEEQQPKRFYTPKNTFALIQVCDSLAGDHLLQEVTALGATDDNIVLFPTLVDFATDFSVFANLHAFQKSS